MVRRTNVLVAPPSAESTSKKEEFGFWDFDGGEGFFFFFFSRERAEKKKLERVGPKISLKSPLNIYTTRKNKTSIPRKIIKCYNFEGLF